MLLFLQNSLKSQNPHLAGVWAHSFLYLFVHHRLREERRQHLHVYANEANASAKRWRREKTAAGQRRCTSRAAAVVNWAGALEGGCDIGSLNRLRVCVFSPRFPPSAVAAGSVAPLSPRRYQNSYPLRRFTRTSGPFRASRPWINPTPGRGNACLSGRGAVSATKCQKRGRKKGGGGQMLTDRCRGGPLNRASQEGRSESGNMNLNAPNDPRIQFWSSFLDQQRVGAVTTGDRITLTCLFGGRTFEFPANPSRTPENFRASRLILSVFAGD